MSRFAYATPEGWVFVLMIYAVIFFCAGHPVRRKMYIEMIFAGMGVSMGVAYFVWKEEWMFLAAGLFFIANMLMITLHEILRIVKRKKN